MRITRFAIGLVAAIAIYASYDADFVAVDQQAADYISKKQYKQAEQVLRAFLAKRPRHLRARSDVHDLLHMQHRLPDAIRWQEDTVSMYPCDAFELASLANTLDTAAILNPDRRALLDRAETAARRAVAIEPLNPTAAEILHSVLRDRSEIDSAHAAALKKEADDWRSRAQQAEKAAVNPTDWDVTVRQGELEWKSWAKWSTEYMRRDMFIVSVREPEDVPVELAIAGDNGVRHVIPQSGTKHRLPKHVSELVYRVESIGDVPIEKTKDCRFVITAKRGAQSIRMTFEPE